ncbi:GyrI-like domain-containing protein [Isosphaeraceae bacterium EP7]
MLDAPQITETADQPTAMIHLTVARSEIQNVMGPGLGEIMAALDAQKISPAGPWFTHHLRMPTDTFDFEICVPVNATIAATGRVKPSQWPAMTVARAIYQGPYEGLGAAWGEFNAWVAASGHTPGSELWERYLKGPESGPDSGEYRTELNRPLI